MDITIAKVSNFVWVDSLICGRVLQWSAHTTGCCNTCTWHVDKQTSVANTIWTMETRTSAVMAETIATTKDTEQTTEIAQPAACSDGCELHAGQIASLVTQPQCALSASSERIIIYKPGNFHPSKFQKTISFYLPLPCHRNSIELRKGAHTFTYAYSCTQHNITS